MTFQARLLCAVAVTGLAAFAATAPANALSSTECSAKYQAAKKDGSLGSMKWNDFRKAQCGADATPAATAPVQQPAATTAAKEPPATTAAKEPPATAPAPMPAGNAVFPNAVDAKYAKETAGKQRFHTCLDQYHANKANNGNGGMNWIGKKGQGSYYSQCNTHLKGPA
jgi:hypothetical protein